MDTAGIDQVLRAAVANGDVPNVTAIAGDRDGVIYEGSAVPRAVGQRVRVCAPRRLCCSIP